MARQGWEQALGSDEMIAMSGGGSGVWRWLTRVFVVVALTLAAAYYLPLHRAHQALIQQHSALLKRVESQDQEIHRLQAAVAAARAEQERREAEQGRQEAKKKADMDRGGELKAQLTSKLSAYAGRGRLAVVAHGDRAIVMVSSGLIRFQGDGLGEPARAALCSIIKTMSSLGPLSFRVGASVTRVEPGGASPAGALGPRELASARAASVARTMEERCAVPTTRILSAGFVQPDGDALGAAAAPPPGDLIELDVGSLEPR